MQRLLEYITHHPYLSGGVVAIAIAVVVNEIRERAKGFAAISASQAVLMMNHGALVLDIRGKDVYDSGHIGEARHVAEGELESTADSLKKKWLEKDVIVYCDSGMRSATAARNLAKLGFGKVVSLAGGMDGWRKENLPVVKSAAVKGHGK